MSTANAYWNRTKLIINTFWFIICVATFSNTLHAEEQLTDSTPAEEQIEDSTPKDNEIKNFQAAEKLKTKGLKAKIIRSESDLEHLKIYEENLEPEHRIFQGVLNFESKLGNKILDILLAPKKPKNTVFRQPATVLIAPHSYHPSQLQQAFDSSKSSELFTMHRVKDACELAELLEELQDDGILEPLSEHKHVFLVADAADMEKLSITGFERLYHDYGKPVAKHKDTIIKVAIRTAVVVALGFALYKRQEIASNVGSIFEEFKTKQDQSLENIEVIDGKGLKFMHDKEDFELIESVFSAAPGSKYRAKYRVKKAVNGEAKIFFEERNIGVDGPINLGTLTDGNLVKFPLSRGNIFPTQAYTLRKDNKVKTD